MIRKVLCHMFDLAKREELDELKRELFQSKIDFGTTDEQIARMTARALGLPSLSETLERREDEAKEDPAVWEGARQIATNPFLDRFADICKLTMTYRIGMDSRGREGDLLNRGSIIGIQYLVDVIKETALKASVQKEKPLEGQEKYKSFS